MRRNRIVSTTAAVTALAVAATAAPALAHVELAFSSPKNKAKLSKAPSSVSLTFSGPLRSGTLKVTGPNGKKVSVGSGARDPRKISRLLVSLKKGLKAGKYTSRASIVAADGHKESFTLTFTVRS
ncbi:copper resistance CopC family protein [Baekduia sp. Peel2402]|uniref:copper resistance CopC family protein n=1 Tax=Baekduia sp. Peel2402 TaxID=3458296 RepID=UPI00403E5C67